MSELRVKWTFSLYPDPEEVSALRQKLRAYNLSQAQTGNATGLTIFLHNEQGQLVGGIAGFLWGACLEIDFLWLEKELRGRSLGFNLLAKLEAEATQRGAQLATLNTYSFQAPDFYQQNGYEIFGVIDGYGPGRPGESYKKYFMRKQLTS